MNARDEGWLAYFLGKSIDDNPYACLSIKSDQWQNGWLDGEELFYGSPDVGC